MIESWGHDVMGVPTMAMLSQTFQLSLLLSTVLAFMLDTSWALASNLFFDQ
jgi:hypothetical protein